MGHDEEVPFIKLKEEPESSPQVSVEDRFSVEKPASSQQVSVEADGTVVIGVSYQPMELNKNGVYHEEESPSGFEICLGLFPFPCLCYALWCLKFKSIDIDVNMKIIRILSHTGICECESQGFRIPFSDVQAVRMKPLTYSNDSGTTTTWQVVLVTQDRGVVEVTRSSSDKLGTFKQALRWNRIIFSNQGTESKGFYWADPTLEEMELRIQYRAGRAV